MRCYKCGNDYDSDAMTCPFCGQRNFVDRIPGTEEESKGEDIFVAWKTRSIPMFVNILDRFVNKVLRVEKIIIAVMILVALFFAVVIPAFHATIRFINKDNYLNEFSSLYEQEQFSLLGERMSSTGCFDREGYEQYTEMVLLYEEYMDFCHARIMYQMDAADGTLDKGTAHILALQMQGLFTDLRTRKDAIPTCAANDPYREQYRREVLVFAEVVLRLTEEELSQLQIINAYDVKDMLAKAIEEMRK